MCVPVLLDPLQKLQIILKLTLYQTLYWNNLVDLVLSKCTLEYLEVVNILILLISIKLHL